ncbi:predicted glycosyltransferase [Chthonomonas calidirosea]|uniref:glycosyltransferase n=1 Tax=Chthonomonas calidirosea TaxID=454171 RepID=UPI0006DD3BC8|nr:glycosyltransferase family 2 protein [Chthonomonas calidirosea]CEK17987.1 predicted glycosyltransferase [Chthonomonas calidirosea]
MLPVAYQALVALLLLAFWGLSRRNLRDYAKPSVAASPTPTDLYILLPARNEASQIAACLDGLLAQCWPHFTLCVLDDGSEDDTAAIVSAYAQRDSRVKLLAGRPLPSGWAGKVWACHQLSQHALAHGAQWLLFLDADTRAAPEFVGALLSYAQQNRAGMVSTFPHQEIGSFWELVAMPMLHFLVLTFLPIRAIWENPRPQFVAACGQVELFSAEAYRACGGHAAIPYSFHDGLQLARRVKAAGYTVRLCDASHLISCRMYQGGRALWSGFTRNAYEGLGSFSALLIFTGLQLSLFLLPFLFLLDAAVQATTQRIFPVWGPLVCLQVGLILSLRWMQAARFGHRRAVWLHPLSLLLLVAVQWASWWRHVHRQPIRWRGREYTT